MRISSLSCEIMSQSSSGNRFASVISSPHKWQKPLFQNCCGIKQDSTFMKDIERAFNWLVQTKTIKTYFPMSPKFLRIDVLCYWLMHTFSDWLKWSSYSYINLTDANNARIEPRCVSQYKPAFRLFKEWIHLNLSDKLGIHNVYVQCLQWMSNCPVNWAWMCTQLIGRQCLHPAQENKHENNI